MVRQLAKLALLLRLHEMRQRMSARRRPPQAAEWNHGRDAAAAAEHVVGIEQERVVDFGRRHGARRVPGDTSRRDQQTSEAKRRDAMRTGTVACEDRRPREPRRTARRGQRRDPATATACHPCKDDSVEKNAKSNACTKVAASRRAAARPWSASGASAGAEASQPRCPPAAARSARRGWHRFGEPPGQTRQTREAAALAQIPAHGTIDQPHTSPEQATQVAHQQRDEHQRCVRDGRSREHVCAALCTVRPNTCRACPNKARIVRNRNELISLFLLPFGECVWLLVLHDFLHRACLGSKPT